MVAEENAVPEPYAVPLMASARLARVDWTSVPISTVLAGL